jgi:hypothetical protein
MVASSLALLSSAAGATLEAALKHAPAALMKFNVGAAAYQIYRSNVTFSPTSTAKQTCWLQGMGAGAAAHQQVLW